MAYGKLTIEPIEGTTRFNVFLDGVDIGHLVRGIEFVGSIFDRPHCVLTLNAGLEMTDAEMDVLVKFIDPNEEKITFVGRQPSGVKV